MSTEGVERKLSSLQAWVTAGLCFIVMFAITTMAVMAWMTYRLSENANRVEDLGTQNSFVLCSLRLETERRLKIFAVDSVGVMPDSIRIPLRDSYKNTLRSYAGLDCPPKE